MPIAAISWVERPALITASAATPNCVYQISFASCSTHPGSGKNWVNSFCATDTTSPCLLNTIALELVVPWSNDKIYFDMALLIKFYNGTLLFQNFQNNSSFS